jgi:hypothetical protein
MEHADPHGRPAHGHSRREMLRRLDVPGPRYTSYPTADRFVEAFGPIEYRQALRQRAQGAVVGGPTPLSLYVHIPFCESVCYYCACNKVITKHHDRGGRVPRRAGAGGRAARRRAGHAGSRCRSCTSAAARRPSSATPNWPADGVLRGLQDRARRRGVDRGRPAHRHPERLRASGGIWVSTASASASRTSTRRCRRPCTACSPTKRCAT